MAEDFGVRRVWPMDPRELVRRFWSEAVSAGLADESLEPGWREMVEEAVQILATAPKDAFTCQPPITTPPGPAELLGHTVVERLHGACALDTVLLLLDLLCNLCRTEFPPALTDRFFARLRRTVASRWLARETYLLRRRLREAKVVWLRDRRRYHTVFMRIQEPALVVDGELLIVDANPAFCQAFRLSREELLGAPVCTVLGAALCGRIDLATVLARRRSFSGVEIELELPDGQRFFVVGGSFLGEINGRPGGGILIFQDVTDKRACELALQCREAQYRTLVENIPDVIWRSTADGRLVYISPNVERLVGFTAEELVRGGRAFWLARILPADRAPMEQAVERLFSSGMAIDLAYRFQRQDGKWIWLQERSGRVYEEGGERLADGVISDITRLKLAEEELERHHLRLAELVDEQTRELRRANAKLREEVAARRAREADLERLARRLQEVNKELEQFAHVVSHDLREPLVLVEAFAKRLANTHADRLDDRGQRYLAAIAKAAGRMQALVSAMLHLARLDAVGRPAEPVVLDQVLSEVVAHLEARLASVNGRVELDCPHTLRGDGVQIWQLFLNLVANAIKYHRPGVPPRVRVQSRTVEDDFCEIVVEDNGIGIRQEDRQRIFQPFTRLQHHGSGCGIGLATCRKIVGRHGGQIDVRQAAGGGAAFIVRLPLWRAEPAV